MKRAIIVLTAILLVFVTACDGDNPAPENTASAPTEFTSVAEDKRSEFVSQALEFFPAIFQEDSISKLFRFDTSVTIKEETVSGTISWSRDSITVSLRFEGFTLIKLAQEQGINVKLWGEYSTTGKAPNNPSTDPGTPIGMSGNSASFDLVIQLSGEGFPEGTYHMSGNFSPADESMTIYLNGDPVTSTIPSSNV